MNKIANFLPSWLEDYHTLLPDIHKRIRKPWKDLDDLSLILALTCPPLFEAYAVAFHPFWIHQVGKELFAKGIQIEVDSLEDEDFERVSWKSFFKDSGLVFSLNNAATEMEKLSDEMKDSPSGWPEYCWFPGEGECEAEELRLILAAVNRYHPSDKVNYHYNQLRTVDWDKDLQFRGSLNDFEKLPRDVEVWGNPSSIYPDDKSWYIGSNYDSPFTYVGGSKELINSITRNDELEIFELPYLIKPEKKND